MNTKIKIIAAVLAVLIVGSLAMTATAEARMVYRGPVVDSDWNTVTTVYNVHQTDNNMWTVHRTVTHVMGYLFDMRDVWTYRGMADG